MVIGITQWKITLTHDFFRVGGREELKGFGLKALSGDELRLVQQTIRDNIPPRAMFNVT